jgi:hypothetical protein
MISPLRRALIGLALATFALGASAQATKNPELGTWKLNLAKSKYNPGPPPKEPTVITMEAAGNGVKYSSKGVNAEGKATGAQYTANYDGKDAPLAGSQTADTVSLKKVDANTVERVDKKGGKVVTTIRREYAKDGKSFIAKVKGVNAKGEPTDNVLHYDRM